MAWQVLASEDILERGAGLGRLPAFLLDSTVMPQQVYIAEFIIYIKAAPGGERAGTEDKEGFGSQLSHSGSQVLQRWFQGT